MTTGKLTPVFVVVYSVPSEYTGEIEFELKSVQRMLFADLGPQAVIVPLYPRIQGAVATLTHRFRVDMKDMSAKPIFTVGSDGRRKDFFFIDLFANAHKEKRLSQDLRDVRGLQEANWRKRAWWK